MMRQAAKKKSNRQMQHAFLTAAALALAMLGAGCGGPSAGSPDTGVAADLSAELVRPRGDGPPPGPHGACWQADLKPAVIETVTEQVLVTPEVIGADGAVETAATFRSETRQRIVEERETVWFRTPCPAEFTVDFIATLQRALKARGLYLLPLSGRMDAPTRNAIRRFQAPLGLDSDHLSLAGARRLGIVSADPTTLR
jgi:hypothetical protein